MRNRKRNNSSEKVGNRRRFIADAVLPGRVSVWLPKETNQHLREKRAPIPVNIEAFPEYTPRNREWPRRMNTIVVGEHPRELQNSQGQQSGQLSVDVWGSSRTLLGESGLESKQRRLSVSKGTWEARSSMVIAQVGCRGTIEPAPMRRSSGGASVVVRDVNDVHMAKGCRIYRIGQPKGSNREGSR